MSVSKIVIAKIVEEMLANVQEMDDISVVPNTFDVYLTDEDYREIQSLFNLLREQAENRLDKELEKRSRGSAKESSKFVRLLKKILGLEADGPSDTKRYQRVEDIWDISFKNCDGKINYNNETYELKKNEVGIIARYSAPAAQTLDSQFKTFLTVYTDDEEPKKTFETKLSSSVDSEIGAPSQCSNFSVPPAASAVLKYKAGGRTKSFPIVKKSITVGRQAADSEADLRLECSEKVSRKHLEIRFDDTAKKYFLKSLGIYGTTVNGKKAPDNFQVVNGNTQNMNVETELPKSARIALAGGEVILDFESKN